MTHAGADRRRRARRYGAAILTEISSFLGRTTTYGERRNVTWVSETSGFAPHSFVNNGMISCDTIASSTHTPGNNTQEVTTPWDVFSHR